MTFLKVYLRHGGKNYFFIATSKVKKQTVMCCIHSSNCFPCCTMYHCYMKCMLWPLLQNFN